jgi:hypothetical protein
LGEGPAGGLGDEEEGQGDYACDSGARDMAAMIDPERKGDREPGEDEDEPRAGEALVESLSDLSKGRRMV